MNPKTRASLAFLCGCLALAATGIHANAAPKVRIDNVPMYGQPEVKRPAALKKADEDFIAQVTKGLGDRKAASLRWVAQGNRFLAERNFDFAMRRFNQAWLLDETNYEAYWGFARVAVELDQFDEGVRWLNRALELCPDPYQRPALLSDLGAAHAYRADAIPRKKSAERSAAFAQANAEFEKAVALEPTYGNAWRRWAIALMYEENYTAAREKVRKAQQLGADPIPPKVLTTLDEKLGPLP